MSRPAILAFDTSGDPACVAVALGDAPAGTPPAELRIDGPRPDAARLLILTIDAVLRSASIDKRQVKTIVVGAGPGSFTGLRIGVAAARTLAFVSGAKLVCHASTSAIAANAFEAEPKASRVAVVLDALRGDFAFALYERGPRHPIEITAPRLIASGDLLATIGSGVLLASPQPAFVAAALASTPPVLDTPRVVDARPSAAALIALFRSEAPRLAHASPLYLRASAAEEKARAAQRPTP